MDSSRAPHSPRQSALGDTADGDEVAQLQQLSHELRLVQRDMICVLQLPQSDNLAPKERKSFKHWTAVTGLQSIPVFPMLEQMGADRINAMAGEASRKPYQKRDLSYYGFQVAKQF